MEPEITEAAKYDNSPKAITKRKARLEPREVTFFIGSCSTFSNDIASFYLTTLGFAGFFFSKPLVRFMYANVTGYEDTDNRSFVIHLRDGSADVTIKKLAKEEWIALKAALDTFPRLGPNAEAWNAWLTRRRELAANFVPTDKEVAKETRTQQRKESAAARAAELSVRQAQDQAEREHQQALKERARTKSWPRTKIPTGPPNKTGGLIILQHCHQGEEPWFIFTSIGAGCMACFSDRLMIIKGGNTQGFMTGTMFGSRSTTFYYHDINALEFNKQFGGSVLEVLTASYQGTANHDFWQGSTKSRNANSGDPYTLSNTLPCSNGEYTRARAEMSELRERIAAAKQNNVTVTMPASPAMPPALPTPGVTAASGDDLVSRLAKLAELRDAGVLTDEEFAAAKARLLSFPEA
ncbi:SHOCT domain-containing protein [Brachybacterium sp.]|uniref:SHOCT domain-containing protein n=1 Tax=Brachybacterium sp. TaxID=1891286 RepID=UPI002ED339CD